MKRSCSRAGSGLGQSATPSCDTSVAIRVRLAGLRRYRSALCVQLTKTRAALFETRPAEHSCSNCSDIRRHNRAKPVRPAACATIDSPAVRRAPRVIHGQPDPEWCPACASGVSGREGMAGAKAPATPADWLAALPQLRAAGGQYHDQAACVNFPRRLTPDPGPMAQSMRVRTTRLARMAWPRGVLQLARRMAW